MSRTKSISSRRHRKLKKQVKGYKHSVRKRIKTSKEALLHAGQYAYIGRKQKKRNFRRLWTMRLNAAAREHGLNYSTLISKLAKANIELDRKMLSEIALNDPETFKKIVSGL